MWGWRRLIVMLIFLGVNASACATLEKEGEVTPSRTTPARAGTAPSRNEATLSDSNGARPRRKSGYRIQVGDEMDVGFYKTPELNSHCKVRPDGNITLPYVGDVRAIELEPEELASLLEERYAGELRVPRITVSVTEFSGQRVFVGGEVKQPGIVPLVGPVTALQAIQQAGGFRDTASLRSIVMIRRQGGQTHGIEIDLSDVVKGESPELDPLLQPFDIVYVPRSAIANVDLFVDQYIRQILPMNPSFGIGLGAF